MSTNFEWLQERVFFGVKAGLENITELCRRLGNPQAKLNCIHVVGSNGKGSTSSLLAHWLQKEGDVGLFTSPHLISIRERFRINGEAIDSLTLEEILGNIREQADDLPLTFFEVATAVALVWFAQKEVKWVVLEAGLGGRWDCTKVAAGSLALLTSISLEHTAILGDTWEKIFAEKVQILHSEGTLVHALPPEKLQDEVLLQTLKLSVSSIKNLYPEYQSKSPFSWGIDFESMPLHQKENALLAAVAYQKITNKEPSALGDFQWAARSQKLEHESFPTLHLDGAHNPDSLQKWADSVSEKVPVVLGVLDDKDWEEMLKIIEKKVSYFYFVTGDSPRFLKAEILATKTNIPHRCFQSVSELWNFLQKESQEIHCIGSLYLMGELIALLCGTYPALAWFKQFSADTNETTLVRK